MSVGFAEVVVVVGIGAAEGHDRRDGVAATSGTTGALLVVGARRRHVAQRHAGQAADVDTDLHRGRARQHVDGGLLRLCLAGQRDVDVLEQQLVLLSAGEDFVGLRRVQLRGVLARR